ncbi:MAG: DUF664 domain-containing protein, partial [Microbacteriaceae bacterium]|nr:DUF664 domain-containing protein [Microbacteriaceae bacterium]
MEQRELLIDAFDRISTIVHRVVEGASADLLAFRDDDEANTIAWLVWHLTRVQDDHVSDVAGVDQLWTSEWAARFELPLPVDSTGYGHSSEQVASVVAPAEL